MNASNKRSLRNAQGFGLVEAILAVAMLGILVAALVPAFGGYANINLRNEIRTGAVAAAQQRVDRLRQQSFDEWPVSGSTQDVNSNGRDFETTLIFCSGDVNTHCTVNSRHLRIEVRFNDNLEYSVETVFTSLR